MSIRLVSRWWLFLVLLGAVQAFAAEKVVILEFEGDKANKLRTQVEITVKKSKLVKVVPIAKWKSEGAKKRLKGSQAMTAAAVAKLAKPVGVVAAVECSVVSDTAAFRILDEKGQELWAKELPIKKGRITEKHAGKLAKAIAAAAEQAASGTAATPAEDDEEKPAEEKPAEEKPTEEKPAEETPVVADPPPVPGALSKEEKEKRRREEEAEANAATTPTEVRPPERDEDLERESGRAAKVKIGPKIFRIWVAGTNTWRTYCAAPGVTKCADFDFNNPTGMDSVRFTPGAPYLGFNINLELFPLSALTSNPLQGLGLVGNFGFGFSEVKITVINMGISTPGMSIVATDRGYSAQLAYRYYFGFGPDANPLVAYVGVRGGLASRVFQVDASAQTPLPSSSRTYGQIGLDVLVPLGSRYAQAVAGFSYFFSPRAGAEEIQAYGDPTNPSGGATGSGFAFEGGLTGDVWGPLGYEVRVRHARYNDRFIGKGQVWKTECAADGSACGGAAEEAYTGLMWGVTLSF